MSQGILMVAAEASADAHGAQVVRALRAAQPQVALYGVGGDAMRAAGFNAQIEAREMAIAGLTEVLWALPRMFRHMRTLERLAASRRPQVAVLMDMPDFNLRLARRLRRLGIPVVYYISPQLWAWRPGRVQQIRALVNEMLVILPFEADFYRAHGVPVHFVGHPLVEQLPARADRSAARTRLDLHTAGPVVAILPGSRRQEVARHLPRMLAGLRCLHAIYPELRAVLPVASTLDIDAIASQVAHSSVPVQLVDDGATDALAAADVAVVCSGTATLQAALLRRPMVVVYRVSWLSYQILRRLVRVAHIGLVNLIAGRGLVPELIQGDFTPQAMAHEVRRLLTAGPEGDALQRSFNELRQQLGQHDTGREVAKRVLRYLPEVAEGRQEEKSSA